MDVERIIAATHEQKDSREARNVAWIQDCQRILQKVIDFRRRNVKYSVYFMEPVDPRKDNAPGYFEVVKNPMDITTVCNRLMNDQHKCHYDFARDMRLVFSNCRLYNTNPDCEVRIMGDRLAEMFEELYAEFLKQSDADKAAEDNRRRPGAAAAAAAAGASGDGVRPQYLVKWKGLSYSEATWEDEDQISDDVKIAQFWRFNRVPARLEDAVKTYGPGYVPQKVYDVSPNYKGRVLRSYQVEGLNWLVNNWRVGSNSILADEVRACGMV